MHALHGAARRGAASPGCVDLTPGIRSLQVHVDPDRAARSRARSALLRRDRGRPARRPTTSWCPAATVHLPLSWDDPATREAIERYMAGVRDDAPWCPWNIEFIRRINGLDSVDDVYRTVFDAEYLVLGLGDVYLGAPVATPLDPRHRLVTTKYNPARTWTPENAVGIGGAYLCIYGMEGPGGYQFVGRTTQVWSRWQQRGAVRAGLALAAALLRPHPLVPGRARTSCSTCAPTWPPAGDAASRSRTAPSRSPTTRTSWPGTRVHRGVPRAARRRPSRPNGRPGRPPASSTARTPRPPSLPGAEELVVPDGATWWPHPSPPAYGRWTSPRATRWRRASRSWHWRR